MYNYNLLIQVSDIPPEYINHLHNHKDRNNKIIELYKNSLIKRDLFDIKNIEEFNSNHVIKNFDDTHKFIPFWLKDFIHYVKNQSFFKNEETRNKLINDCLPKNCNVFYTDNKLIEIKDIFIQKFKDKNLVSMTNQLNILLNNIYIHHNNFEISKDELSHYIIENSTSDNFFTSNNIEEIIGAINTDKIEDIYYSIYLFYKFNDDKLMILLLLSY
jgi:hypothetical protein